MSNKDKAEKDYLETTGRLPLTEPELEHNGQVFRLNHRLAESTAALVSQAKEIHRLTKDLRDAHRLIGDLDIALQDIGDPIKAIQHAFRLIDRYKYEGKL